jgi:dTDP-glucose 4,6-dehydratase
MRESVSVLYAQEYDFEAKIARCFSFIGPYLPLDGRFAVSDFILDALSERSITVKGDGKSVRTYLYMADLVKWLWRILFIGDACKPYNVGSELPVSIRQLAEAFAEASNPPLGISILNHDISGVAQNHYVPDTEKARLELGLQQHIPLAVAIQKTLKWFGWLECR